ncbi:hypothetical protein Ddye_002500 [Dipteronia dyeriana]|uniref:Nuclease HARBI1 n=1 Tax=Dipteronia dyeriana TaxID=168575 RepID=A0AAE0CUI0_9ROSI|nr:hypothetical protein Ddye_002500 [Dipteronia dyeriana]
MKQGACRKDVERAFRVLQSRFAIVAGPTRFWHKHVLHDIMSTCIIIHNMIIADECDVDASIGDRMKTPTPEIEIMLDENTRFQQFLTRHREIRNKDAHIALRNVLIEHLSRCAPRFLYREKPLLTTALCAAVHTIASAVVHTALDSLDMTALRVAV